MSVEGQTFPKSVQPGLPKLGTTPKGWKRYRIGELFDVVSRPTDLHDDQEYDLVTVKRSRGGIERRSHLLGRQISVKSQFLLEEGDFLISKRQIVHGACAVVPAEFSGSIVSNEYSVLRPRPVLNLSYLRYLVHSVYLQQTFFHSSVGVHVEKMIFRLEDWFKWPIHLPPVAEQEKLGRGLTDADAKITLLTDKKNALEDYKRGLMQRLFSRELRFTRDDGSAFPDWAKVRLGKLITPVRGLSYSGEDVTDDGLTVLRSNNIKDKRLLLKDTVCVRSTVEEHQLVRPGDILLCANNGSRKLIGKSALIPNPAPRAAHGAFMLILRGIENEFVFQLLQTEEFFRKVHQDLGAVINSINASALVNFGFHLPSSADERIKIAAALSALDAKIDALSQKISEMEAFKKGLLQKLFV